MPAALIESTCEEIAAAIYRVRLPLPFALNHVNCYLLRDADGWTILDAGLNRPEIYAGWQAAFAGLGIAPTAIRRIIITHMHPDHIGMAGRLQQGDGRGGFPVARRVGDCTGDVGAESAARNRGDGLSAPGWGAANGGRHRRGAGAEAAPHDAAAAGGCADAASRRHASPWPGGAARFYTRRVTPRRRSSFTRPAERLLLCGDHVLQRITPNIGYWPSSQPDPLGRYLASLRSLLALEVALALPGHYGAITDWRGRLHELLAHHDDRLEVAFTAAAEGATALEASYRIFNFDRFSPHEVRFAVAEALAHLEYLADAGRLMRCEQDGFAAYRAA
jgi:glyoxylase-like metal-dependent hydrolase (beta-lactamase superfamily II)